MAGNFFPLTPTMLSLLTFSRRRRSNKLRPTTPTFLSEPEAPVPTQPVVYSPVPTCRGCHVSLAEPRNRQGLELTINTLRGSMIDFNHRILIGREVCEM